MYFYRELASHVSLTSWRNSLFSPLPCLSSTDSPTIHLPFFKISSKFRVKRFLFFFYLLTLKFTPIFPFLFSSKSCDRRSANNEERNSNGWRIKRCTRLAGSAWLLSGTGRKIGLAEKRGGRDAARAKQIVANKKLIHGGELEGANT